MKHDRFVGITAAALAGMMVLLYLIPGSGATLTGEEFLIVGGWMLLGIVFYILCRKRYGKEFGRMN